MIFKQWKGPWPPKDSDHPFEGRCGEPVLFCPYPFDWTDHRRCFVEATVVGAWYDNDYPVCNIAETVSGRRHTGIMVDRLRWRTIVDRIAELA